MLLLTDIQRSTRHVIELAPPRQVSSPDQELEDERHDDPDRVIDARRRWDELHRVQDERYRNVSVPAIRPLALPVPERYRQEDTNNDGVYLGVVDGALPKLTCRSNQSPAISDVSVPKPSATIKQRTKWLKR